jgi:hypothetical protein
MIFLFRGGGILLVNFEFYADNTFFNNSDFLLFYDSKCFYPWFYVNCDREENANIVEKMFFSVLYQLSVPERLFYLYEKHLIIFDNVDPRKHFNVIFSQDLNGISYKEICDTLARKFFFSIFRDFLFAQSIPDHSTFANYFHSAIRCASDLCEQIHYLNVKVYDTTGTMLEKPINIKHNGCRVCIDSV